MTDAHFGLASRVWLTLALLFGSSLSASGQASEETLRRWEELNSKVIEAYEEGDQARGLAWAQQAYELAEETFGARDPNTLTSLDNLALLYQGQGRYDEAEPLLRDALRLSQEVLGPNHPQTLQRLTNLALHYQRQQRYDEAEALFQEALEVSRKFLGPSHPQTMRSLNNLAALYESQAGNGNAARERLAADLERLERSRQELELARAELAGLRSELEARAAQERDQAGQALVEMVERRAELERSQWELEQARTELESRAAQQQELDEALDKRRAELESRAAQQQELDEALEKRRAKLEARTAQQREQLEQALAEREARFSPLQRNRDSSLDALRALVAREKSATELTRAELEETQAQLDAALEQRKALAEELQLALAERGARAAVKDSGWDIVRVFYGTDRRNAGDAILPRFSGERSGKLSLGSVHVSVPSQVHKIGAVERPWRRTYFGISWGEDEDPEQHFVIQRIEELGRANFLTTLREVVDASQGFEDQALVFIHGYNVNFDAAAYRTAQIAYDLQFDGAPIFYSWPSNGSIEDYEYDQNSARQSRPFFKEFLEMVRRESGAEVIHLIAHSMGNDPLMEVLAEINVIRVEGEPLFNEIILAAPDIDVDLFYQLAKQVTGVARGFTLYASAEDHALRAARAYAGGVPRAGDVPSGGPLILPGIDTIDITSVGANLLALNHSEYAENRLLLDDIGRLLKTGRRPPTDRSPTLRRRELQDGTYWYFPR